MLDSARKIISISAKNLGLSRKEIDDLLEPDHIHKAVLNIDGKSYDAYRVQHKNVLGPYKGGIRFHHEVDFEEVQALATLMSFKTAATGLPLGGGKGGVVIDPKQHDKSHLEEVSREYVRALHPHLGPYKDIPAPDVNTDAEVIDWMVDEYESISGDTTRASFTGKSLALGGSEGREEATGRGGVIVLREVLKARKINPKDLTLAVQGLGNVGFYFAKIAAEELGVTVVAVSNSRKAIFSLDGFDFSDADFSRQVVDELEPEADYAGAAADILKEEVDVLVCAALADAITADNSASVHASIILELANGPVSHEAYEDLTKAGIEVIPDIIANAGGVIVSYYEWLQNKSLEKWPKAEVLARLDASLTEAANTMIAYADINKITLKQAAFQIAIAKLLGKL